MLKYTAPSAMDATAIPASAQKSAFTAMSLEHKQKRPLHQRKASLLPKFFHQREYDSPRVCGFTFLFKGFQQNK